MEYWTITTTELQSMRAMYEAEKARADLLAKELRDVKEVLKLRSVFGFKRSARLLIRNNTTGNCWDMFVLKYPKKQDDELLGVSFNGLARLIQKYNE